MRVRAVLGILTLIAAPLSAQKTQRAQIIPVPDASWHPITKPDVESASTIVAVKRAGSIAHQSGELRVSAVIGGETPEMLLAAGANQLIFAGGAKPGDKEDFLARACWFNGQGDPVRQILLVESRLVPESAAVAETLLALQRDYDLVDAGALTARGRIADRKIQVGAAGYEALLLAPSDRWPEEMLDVVEQYIDAGGRVLFLGRQPLSIQRLLLRTGVVRVSEAPEDIERGLNYAVGSDFHASDSHTGADLPMVRYQHRSDGARDYFLIVNLDREHAAPARFSIGGHGSIQEWDLWTGVVSTMRLPMKEIPPAGVLAVVVR